MSIRIAKIHIKNFRSILDLKIEVEQKNGIIVFCGANNVGKTNVLKALALFFNKNIFLPHIDCPSHKYHGSRGGSYKPKIEILFDNGGDKYNITKDWNLKHGDETHTDTFEDDEEHGYNVFGTKNGEKITKKEINNFLEKIHFFFLEAINISFPEIINMLIENVFELEASKKRIRGSKKELKSKIEEVLGELRKILDDLVSNISPLLENYREGWGLGYDIPQEIESFSDLMIAKTDFYIQDKSNGRALDTKGSGLQRLSHILMHFRILEKFNDDGKSWIFAIDEPDVYLHAGLQKKLLSDMKKYGNFGQFFITTHSPIFIDCSTFENVNLLEQNIGEKVFARTGNKKHNCISTDLVGIDNNSGIQKIKDYLGIKQEDFLIFDGFNIVVEGECDKVYLEKLFDIYGYDSPTITSCNGANNIGSFLSYCDALAKKGTLFRVILDNDSKGRELYQGLKKKKFSNIRHEILFIDENLQTDDKNDNKKNIEIEDIIPIEIICDLLNIILKQAELQGFTAKEILGFKEILDKPVFKNRGVLDFLEIKKNEKNPNNGDKIGINTLECKKGLANLFKSKLKKDQINLLSNNEAIHAFIDMVIRQK